MKSLSEMFTKKFIPTTNKQSALLELVQTYSESQEHADRISEAVVAASSTPLVEYKHEDMKRRAMTVASAFEIAAKLYLSMVYKKGAGAYLDTSIFKLKEDEMLKAEEVADELSFGSVKLTYTNQMNIINNLVSDLKEYGVKVAEEDLPYDISRVAIQLAWLEAYVESGFFPKDISVMETYSETNTKLIEEVKVLLEVFIDYCKNVGLNEETNFVFNPSLDDLELDVEGTRGIIIEDTFVELKTTGSMDKNIQKDSKTNLAYFGALKDKYRLETSVLYYIRYDLAILNYC